MSLAASGLRVRMKEGRRGEAKVGPRCVCICVDFMKHSFDGFGL